MTGVAERLDRRITVLTLLIDEGPEALVDDVGESVSITMPTSLNKVRTWHEPRLGIEPIGDPASFTRGHPRHGSKVQEIDRLLKRLPKAKRRGRARSVTAEAEDLRRQLANANEVVVKLTGQLAAKGHELRAERALRLENERVLAQMRSRERKAAQNRDAKLVLVGSEP